MNELDRRRVFVWWTLWGAFMASAFFYYFTLRGAHPATASDSGSSAWLVSFVPLGLSVFIRLMVLPRARRFQAAFGAMVAGIAFAEVVCLFGLLLFPAHKFTLMVLGVAGIVQFAPIYARRTFS
jgi:hypothetical protein